MVVAQQAAQTYEGDNLVMLLQLARFSHLLPITYSILRYLMKAAADVKNNQSIGKLNGYLARTWPSNLVMNIDSAKSVVECFERVAQKQASHSKTLSDCVCIGVCGF
jgi:hypothetical protein